mgnify:CR=1 FL=1
MSEAYFRWMFARYWNGVNHNVFRKKEKWMEKINIAIVCEEKHKASIYTLVASIIINKNRNSRYCIYIITNGTEKEHCSKLLEYQEQLVEIFLYEKPIEELKGIGKLIYLQWNTIVLGDLSKLYEVELEGKPLAAVPNVPERAYIIPSSIEEYNTSVLFIDTEKMALSSKEYKELPLVYNYGYEEFINNREKIGKQSPIGQDEYDRIKDCALIVRMDKEYPPEIYFDAPLSELWMKYYRMSLCKEIHLDRKAFLETIGFVSVKKENAIPILLFVEDKSVAYSIAFLFSLEKHNVSYRNFDIRFVYHQLSKQYKELLLSLISTNLSVVLYQIKRGYTKESFSLLAPLIFSEYSNVFCSQAETICMDDIGKYYDCSMEHSWMQAEQIGEIEFDVTRCCINIEEWYNNGVGTIIQKMLNDKNYSSYSINKIFSMACWRNTKVMKNIWITPQNTIFASLVENYLSEGKLGEQLKQELLLYEKKEEEDVREVLEKLQQLENDNENLKRRMEELEQENKNFKRERDQFLFEILEIRKSITYKIGRIITFLPRKLRKNK